MTITNEMARIEAEIRRCKVNKAGRRIFSRALRRRAVVEFSKLDFSKQEYAQLIGVGPANFGKWYQDFQPSVKREMRSATVIPPHSEDTMVYNRVSPTEPLHTDAERKMKRIMHLASEVGRHEQAIATIKAELKTLI